MQFRHEYKRNINKELTYIIVIMGIIASSSLVTCLLLVIVSGGRAGVGKIIIVCPGVRWKNIQLDWTNWGAIMIQSAMNIH
jgi:hypothetical protein